MLEPVGPLSPRTYWIRRAALIVVAVVVVVVLLFLVIGRSSTPSPVAATVPTTTAPLTGELATTSSGSSAIDLTSSMFPDAASVASAASAASASVTAGSTGPSAPGSAVDATAPTTSAVASEVTTAGDTAEQAAAEQAAAAQVAAEQAAAAEAAQAAQVAAEQAAAAQAAQAAQAAADAAAAQAAADAARPRDGEGRLICPDSSVQLTATVGSPTYTVGQQPIVGVTVANVGTEACVRDVSGSMQEYLAYDAAGNRVWSTNDCLPGSGTDVRFLQPGESLQYNIKWSGTTSQPGCAAERTRVPAGEYRIEARIGSLVSSQAALTLQ